MMTQNQNIAQNCVQYGANEQLTLLGIKKRLCKNPKCKKPLKGRNTKVFCSDTCRAEYHRIMKKEKRKKRRELMAQMFFYFDYKNPEIFKDIKSNFDKFINLGTKRISIKGIIEDLRRDKDYHINNNYTSYYARKLVSLYPYTKKYIEIRNKK